MALLSARRRAALGALALTALCAPGASAAAPDLADVTLAELDRALTRGDVTCRQVVRHGLRRIARHDGTINAVISVNPRALKQAARLDRRSVRRRGDAHCVPLIVKDNIETRGLRTTFGSSLFAGWVPERDAPVVRRLRAEGAIVLAKGNLDDFAAAVYGVSEIDGWIRNPYDPGRTVGGSSGGPAAGVAAGYAALGIGTDTGGSLRIPAAFNGVVTIRPTIGTVSREGMSPRALTQDTAGPLARTVADAARGLDLIDELRVPYAAYARGGRLRGVRIGVIRQGIPLWGGIQPGVAALEERALAELESLGAEVVDLPQAFVDRLDRGFACGDCLLDSGVIGFEARRDLTAYLQQARPAPPVRSFDELYASGRYTPQAKEAFDREAGVDLADPETAAAYRTALARRGELRAATLQMLGELDLDAVAYPSATWFPEPLGVEQSGVFTRWSEHTGFPALGVPMGLGPLPASLELLGRPYAEPVLIRIAAAYERAARSRVPPPLAR